MPLPKIILLAINIIGGIAVITSYVYGLTLKGVGANVLWGGIPESIRPVYIVSMIIAAIGYFAFIYYILFKLNVASFSFSYFYLIFLGILLPSALWMPLTSSFITNPNDVTWTGVKIVLIIVGVFSIILGWTLFNLKGSGIAYWLAVFGSFYFAFHTAFLDMILWPILFKK